MHKRIIRVIVVELKDAAGNVNGWGGGEAAQNEEGRRCTTWGIKCTMAWFTLTDNYRVISEEKQQAYLCLQSFPTPYILQSHNKIMHAKQQKGSDFTTCRQPSYAENACSGKLG